LWNDEDIRKYDGGINEVCIPLDGLQCEGRGNLGRAAAIEEIVLAFSFVILWEVSSS
jgi:hypothetical protein